MVRYRDLTEDDEFEREAGLELLVETARLWRSLGHHDADGNFRIDGVTPARGSMAQSSRSNRCRIASLVCGSGAVWTARSSASAALRRKPFCS